MRRRRRTFWKPAAINDPSLCKTETEQEVQSRLNPDKLHILIHFTDLEMTADAENNRE